jgi:uncharacterized protein YqjF (DUF2071 family)
MCGVEQATQRLLSARQHPGRRAVMHQRWDDLFFFHWRVDPAEVQRRFPRGLTVDCLGGATYLGVVGFKMNAVRPAYLPPLPWLSFFNELNVRVYVRDAAGEPGVFFFSLDCDRWPAVKIARAQFALNYQHAQMRHQAAGQGFTLDCQRAGATANARYAWQPVGAPTVAEPGTLEFFLAERYNFFTEKDGRLLRGQVHHAPYPLQKAEVQAWSEAPVAWDGFPTSQRPPDLAHASSGVSIEAFGLVPAHA